jgi:hypothetical protein
MGSTALARAVWIVAMLGAGCGLFDGAMSDDTMGAGQYPTTPSTSSASSSAPASPRSPSLSASPIGDPVLEYDDAQALAWMQSHCGACHLSNSSRTYMTWPMPQTLTREWLEATEATTVAYELMRRKAHAPETPGLPSPMPLGTLDASGMVELGAVVRWFERTLPFSVKDADVLYVRKPDALPRPSITLQCKAPTSLQTFMTRLTQFALNRSPTPAELTAFPAADLSANVTPAERQSLVARLATVWKTELMAAGLVKLANTIATAGAIQSPSTAPVDGVADEISAGASDELNQLMQLHYDDWDYTRYFTENVVIANPTTAPIYGCTVTQGLGECALVPPRYGFFSTLGYLQLLPQSFMRPQNNTRRYAGTHMTLIAESHARANVIGLPAGPPPSCLESTDTRYELPNLTAGFGTWSTLQTGQVCQSCHARGVAAGEILFRPFASSGRIYDPAKLGVVGSPDAADFTIASGPTWVHADTNGGATTQVTGAFLTSILTAPRKACVATDDPAEPLRNLDTVADLVTYMMRDRDAVLRGFTRHAHRVFSAPTAPAIPTLEMEVRSLLTSDAGKSKLPDLIAAYFASDSFACGEDL